MLIIGNRRNVRVSRPKVVDHSHIEPVNIDERIRVIFAPDPETGWPDSDLQVLVSDKQRPEIKEFIRSTLMSVQKPLSKTDEDTAMLTCPNAQETRAQYIARLQEFGQQSVNDYNALLELSRNNVVESVME